MQENPNNFAREEFANGLTHGGGLLLAVVGAFLLFRDVAGHPNESLRIGCGIYAIALVALYAASTLSHLYELNSPRRDFYRSLDQGIIFLFIAANFTPFAIAYLQGEMLWILMAAMWGIALVGFCSKVFWKHRVEATAVTHYLALGWLPLTVIEPIFNSLPMGGIIWCIAGGVCYSIGTIVLTFDTKVPYFHALWHLLVIAGGFCHFMVIIDYAIPLRP